MGYDWDFRVFVPYAHAFLLGAWVTVKLTVISSIVGTVIGIPLGAIFRVRPIAKFLLPLNDIARAIPMLLLMVLCYYFPYKAVFGVEPLSAFAAAVLALTIAQAVFTADLVRAAVDGVSQQVILGARALGLHDTTVWRYIILPDIIRQISPALLAFYIGNLKLSSLASAIGCEELLFTARAAGDRTARNLEGLIIVTGIYILFVLPLAWGARRLEQSRWLKRRS